MGITDKVIHTPEVWNTPRPRVSRQTMNTGYIRRIARNAGGCCVTCELTTDFTLNDVNSGDFLESDVYGPYQGGYLVGFSLYVVQGLDSYTLNVVAVFNEDAGTITLVSPQVAFFQTGILPTVTNNTTNQTRVITGGEFRPGGSGDQESTFEICGDFFSVGTLILDCKDNPPAVIYTLTIIDSPDSATIGESHTGVLPRSLVLTPFGHYEIEVTAPGYITQIFTIEFTSNGQTEDVCLDPI